MHILSKCCNAPIKIGGEHTTHYYICTKCNKSCDTQEYQNKLAQELQDKKG